MSVLTPDVMHRTYRYGAKAPEGWSSVEDAAHQAMVQYWNDMRDIRVAAYTGHQNLIYPEGSEARQLLARAKQRGHPEQKAAAIALKALRTTREEICRGKLETLRRNEKQVLKQCRQQSGLWWHHYHAVQQHFGQAEQLCRKNRGQPSAKDAASAPFAFSLFFPRGLAVQDFLLGKSALIRLESSVQTRKVYLHFATAPTKNGDHKTLRIPTTWHRDLPKQGVIRRVDLVNIRALRATQWKLLFTVAEPAPIPISSSEGTRTYCGIDLGWRMQEDSLRVAYWSTNSDQYGEIVLPPLWLDKARYLEKLRQQIQLEAQLCASQLSANPLPVTLDPVHPTRDLIRLYQVNKGLPEPALAILVAWWAKNARAIREAEGLSSRLRRQRSHIYQEAAKQLAKDFDAIGTEHIELKRLKELQKENAPYIVRRSQQWAALNELLHWLNVMCKKHGKAFLVVPSTNNTQRCARCGHINRQSTLKKLVGCESCQAIWDQDFNASANIVRRMIEAKEPAELLQDERL